MQAPKRQNKNRKNDTKTDYFERPLIGAPELYLAHVQITNIHKKLVKWPPFATILVHIPTGYRTRMHQRSTPLYAY